MVPHDLVIDRCYLHGDAGFRPAPRRRAQQRRDQHQSTRISRTSRRSARTRRRSMSWNGPGPFLIENNYIEAAAGEHHVRGHRSEHPEPAFERHRHPAQPDHQADGVDDVDRGPSRTSSGSKNAQRVTIEGNVIENQLGGRSAGLRDRLRRRAIRAAPRRGATRPRRHRSRSNVIRHVAAVFNISGYDDLADEPADAEHRHQQQPDLRRQHRLGDPGHAANATPRRASAADRRTSRFDHNTVRQQRQRDDLLLRRLMHRPARPSPASR